MANGLDFLGPTDFADIFSPRPTLAPVSPLVTFLRGLLGGAGLQNVARERQRVLGEQESERTRRAAREQLDYWHQLYGSPQNAFATLGDQYIQTTKAAGFGAPPTRPQTVAIGTQRPEEGGLGRFLAPTGTQEVPTGKQELALPKPQPRLKTIVLFNEATGQSGTMQIPADAELRTYRPPNAPARSVLVDRNGKTIRVFEPGETVHVAPEPTSDVIPPVSPSGQRYQLLPPVTKGGRSRIRDNETGAVMSWDDAASVVQKERNKELADAMGIRIPQVQIVTPHNRQQAVVRMRKILARRQTILSYQNDANVWGKATLAQRDKYQEELNALKEEYDRLMMLLQPAGR